MKKIIFIFTMIFLTLISCEKEEVAPPIKDEEEEEDILAGLDCPNVEMVQLTGYVIQLPYSNIQCGDHPYPQGFKDISGNLTDLGNVSGGFIEFINCNPGTYEGTPVFIAEYIGEFVDFNKDTVFYEGTFTFDPTTQGEGIRKSPSVITGGTGRWVEAEGCFRFYDITRLDNGTFKASVEGKITPPGIK